MSIRENNVTIRPVRPGDEDILALVQTESWKAAFKDILEEDVLKKCTEYDRATIMYRKLLEARCGQGYLLLIDERPHGIAWWDAARDADMPGWAELICIHSLPDRWHKGYGSQLMQRVLQDAAGAGYDRILLWVFEENERAISFYKKHGFVDSGKRKTGLGATEAMHTKIINDRRKIMKIETPRLFLREMSMDDYDALYAVLADSDIMCHYPYTFDEARVKSWIERNQARYQNDGFGLWAVCLKKSGETIGDCGLTLQPIDGEMLPQIGYHIRADQQHKGYAREAAAAVRDWAFENTAYDALYSYCKYTNVPSYRTAESIGMQCLKEYKDDVNEITHVSILTRDAWMQMKKENAIQQ